MAGKGPPPKRESQRRRRNEPATKVTKAEGAAVVDVPSAKAGWHPVAKAWFESLARSGQSQFYEPSDWATAVFVAESMSRDLRPKIVGFVKETGKPIKESPPVNGAAMAAYLKAMASLLVLEGDRRRVSVELERPKSPQEGEASDGGSVTWLDAARRNKSG